MRLYIYFFFFAKTKKMVYKDPRLQIIKTHTPNMHHWQYGSGLSDIGEIYRSRVNVQRGRGGVANFFGGLLKYMLPAASSAATALGGQAMKSGGNVVRDLMAGKTLRNSLYDQGQNAIGDLSAKGINKLKRMQKGRGIHTRHATGRSIKGSRRRPRMLVGGRKRSAIERLPTGGGGPRRTRRRRKTGSKKTRSRRKKTTAKQIGGRRKRRKTPKKAGRRRKATRSVDIFDI